MAGSVRSTGPATSMREDTSSFRNRCGRGSRRSSGWGQLGGDLGVRLAVDHESRHVELPVDQRLDEGNDLGRRPRSARAAANASAGRLAIPASELSIDPRALRGQAAARLR